MREAKWWKVSVTFALCLVWLWFLQFATFPNIGAGSLLIRGVSAFCAGTGILIIVVLSFRCPAVFYEPVWSICSLIASVIGIIFIAADFGPASIVLSVVGFMLCDISAMWFMVLAGVTALKMVDERARTQALVIGYMMRVLLVVLVTWLMEEHTLVIEVTMGIVPFVIYLLVRPHVKQSMAEIRFADAAEQMSVTHPDSYLPFSSKTFISILFFTCMIGYATGAPIRTGIGSLWFLAVSVPVFILTLCLLRLAPFGSRSGTDGLYWAAVVLVTIGCIAGPIWSAGTIQVVSDITETMLLVAADCFTLFMYLLLFKLASRNYLSSISLIAFGGFAINLGVAIDALLWWLADHFVESFIPSTVVIAMFFIAFILFNIIFLRNYSFEKTADSLKPIAKVMVADVRPSFQEDCDLIAQAYHLTVREKDIMELLARGRNSRSIQDKLVVSRNTVKTHVRNIYGKMNVHSQQELIDLVEKQTLSR